MCRADALFSFNSGSQRPPRASNTQRADQPAFFVSCRRKKGACCSAAVGLEAEQSASRRRRRDQGHPPAPLCCCAALLSGWLAGWLALVPADLLAAVWMHSCCWLARRRVSQEHHTAFLARHAADHRARHAHPSSARCWLLWVRACVRDGAPSGAQRWTVDGHMRCVGVSMAGRAACAA